MNEIRDPLDGPDTTSCGGGIRQRNEQRVSPQLGLALHQQHGPDGFKMVKSSSETEKIYL